MFLSREIVQKCVNIKFCIKIVGWNGSYSANTQPIGANLTFLGFSRISLFSDLLNMILNGKNCPFELDFLVGVNVNNAVTDM